MGLLKTYNYYVYEIADSRVKDWPFMSGLLPILTVIAIYLYITKVFGPKFMENRKPYNITNIIRLYNIFQVIACTVLIYKILQYGWTTQYSLGCKPVNYSNDLKAVNLAGWIWWTVMLKMVELIETVFFVLRKNFNQVSNLHLYHHVSTFLLGAIGAKYVAGGMTSFPILINSVVHIIMYTYYFLSTYKSISKSLNKWKSIITVIQMIQLIIVTAYFGQIFLKECDYPKSFSLIFMLDFWILFGLFFNFYKTSYKKSK